MFKSFYFKRAEIRMVSKETIEFLLSIHEREGYESVVHGRNLHKWPNKLLTLKKNASWLRLLKKVHTNFQHKQ